MNKKEPGLPVRCNCTLTIQSSTSSFPGPLELKELLHLLTFSLLGRGGSEGLQSAFEQGGHLVSSIITKVS